MTSVLKKCSLFIATMLTAGTIQANGADSILASCCEQNYNPSPCCAPTCNPGPYCGPNCIPSPYCNEWNIKGELLYWRPQLCGLESAFGDTTIATTVSPGGVITTTVTELDKEPDFEWDLGFRVGTDYAFTCFDLEADWTHFHGEANFNEGAQNGKWKIKYDAVDLIFGRRFCVAPCFYFKPFIGARGLKLHQTLNSHLAILYTSVLGNNTVFTDLDEKEDFWGVGPQLGLEANWYLGCSFSIYGSFDVVTYYGKVKGQNSDTDLFPSTVNTIIVSNSTKRRCFSNIGTDGAIGIRWDTAWHGCNYDVLFMLKAGLEQHRIYDFSNLGSDGTLSLDGANFGAGIGLRY